MRQQVIVQEEPRGPSILLEIPVSVNGAQRIPLPDIAQLRSTVSTQIVIKGIRLISAEVLTNGIISAFATAPAAELAKMSLTLYSEGWEKGQTIPLLTLNDMAFTTGAIPYRQNPTKFDDWVAVDWPKSYIQYANSTSSAGAPYVILLDVQYVRLNGSGNTIVGPAR